MFNPTLTMGPIYLLFCCLGFLFNNSFAQEDVIRHNLLGYLPDDPKVAVLGLQSDRLVSEFTVEEALSGTIVHRAEVGPAFPAFGSFQRLHRLDFSVLQTPGTYYLRVGDLSSHPIVIDANAYTGAADFLLQYMRQQRCGYNPFFRDSCHTNDGIIVDHPTRTGEQIDVTGGWHDASDYLQYTATSANAALQMLLAYEHFPQAFGDQYDAAGIPGQNGQADILDEARWGLDWLLRMNPDSGLYFNQIADDRDHTTFTLPTVDSVDYGWGAAGSRPVYPVTGKRQGLGRFQNRSTGVSSSAAKFASAFALGARVFNQIDPAYGELLQQKAAAAFTYALSDLGVNQTASNRAPYFYEEENYTDDLELAAAQLFHLTQDSSYQQEAVYWGRLEAVTPWMLSDTARHYQWYPFFNLGHYETARSLVGDERNLFLQNWRKGLDGLAEKAARNGFQMGVPFIWCSNNLVTAALSQMHLYRELTGDVRYRYMEAAFRDWLLGCNPWGTSMITDFPAGVDTPVDPHSALTARYGFAIPGGLVDGPIYTSIFNKLIGLKIVNGDEYAAFQSNDCVYHDDWGDYSTNEPTMDGTACLTYYWASQAPPPPKEETTTQRVDQWGALIREDTTQAKVYLVFTAHEYADGGVTVRQVLKEKNVPAHFFFTGDFYRNPQRRSLIQGLHADGHYLGAHSDQHLLYAPWGNRDSLLIDQATFVADVRANYQEMARFGMNPEQAHYYLPPYEWYNEQIGHWTQQLGLQLVNYSPGLRTAADYTTPDMQNYRSSAALYDDLFQYESQKGLNGMIILLHLGTHPDRTDKLYDYLEPMIRELRKRGYRFGRWE